MYITLGLLQSTISSNNAAIYTHVGATSVMLWDIVSHLKDDYRLIQTDFCLKTFLYFFCRAMSTLYAILKTVYLTNTHIHMCRLLEKAISSIFAASTSSMLFLALIQLVLLLDRNQKVLQLLCSLWFGVVASTVVFAVGMYGIDTPQQLCQEELHGQWTGVSFVAIFFHHSIMLGILCIALRHKSSADHENRRIYERYSWAAHKNKDYLHYSKPLTTADYMYYIPATILSTFVMVWFFASRTAGALPTTQTIPLVIYLVISSITIGSCLRETKFSEAAARNLGTVTAPQIKLDHMASSNINDTLNSTTRIIEPSYNQGRGAHCDVIGLFDTDSHGCVIQVPPAVEVEVKRVVEGHDTESTNCESEC